MEEGYGELLDFEEIGKVANEDYERMNPEVGIIRRGKQLVEDVQSILREKFDAEAFVVDGSVELRRRAMDEQGKQIDGLGVLRLSITAHKEGMNDIRSAAEAAVHIAQADADFTVSDIKWDSEIKNPAVGYIEIRTAKTAVPL